MDIMKDLEKAHKIAAEHTQLKRKIHGLNKLIMEIKNGKNIEIYIQNYIEGFERTGGFGFMPVELTEFEQLLILERKKHAIQLELDKIKLPKVSF
jgi:hypothetical protein